MELEHFPLIKSPAEYAKVLLLCFTGNKVKAVRFVLAQTKLGKSFRNETITALQAK